MTSFIEALYKSPEKITFGWNAEVGAYSYKIYVGLSPTSAAMTLLYSNISAQVSQVTPTVGKVAAVVDIADVRTALSLLSTVDFNNKVFYIFYS